MAAASIPEGLQHPEGHGDRRRGEEAACAQVHAAALRPDALLRSEVQAAG